MRVLAAVMLFAFPAAALAEPPQVTVVGKKPDADPDRVTCKSTTVTGSLARTKKICMAASDWRQQREDIQRFNSDHITTCTTPGGCGE